MLPAAMSAARSLPVLALSSKPLIPSRGSDPIPIPLPAPWERRRCEAEPAQLVTRVGQGGSSNQGQHEAIVAPGFISGDSGADRSVLRPRARSVTGRGGTALLSLCLHCLVNPGHSRSGWGGSKPHTSIPTSPEGWGITLLPCALKITQLGGVKAPPSTSGMLRGLNPRPLDILSLV